MGYVYFVNFFVVEWRSLDREFRDFVPIVGLSGIALFLMAIRNAKGINKHLLTSMEVLIIVSVPSIVGLQFLFDIDVGKSIFPGGIALFSVAWGIYFGFKRGKTDEEQKDIDKARLQIILMFVVLVSFSLIAFGSIETIQNIIKNDT